MTGKELEFYEKETPADAEVKALMDEEIAHVPQAPGELSERLSENHAASPADSGGDVQHRSFGEYGAGFVAADAERDPLQPGFEQMDRVERCDEPVFHELPVISFTPTPTTYE